VKEFARVGCKFAERCPYVMDICKREEPGDIFIDERIVKCHLYRKCVKRDKIVTS